MAVTKRMPWHGAPLRREADLAWRRGEVKILRRGSYRLTLVPTAEADDEAIDPDLPLCRGPGEGGASGAPLAAAPPPAEPLAGPTPASRRRLTRKPSEDG